MKARTPILVDEEVLDKAAVEVPSLPDNSTRQPIFQTLIVLQKEWPLRSHYDVLLDKLVTRQDSAATGQGVRV